MSDGFMLYLDDDGVARHYDDTYDITIHCESEEEQQKVIEAINSRRWIPCSERLPEKPNVYTVTDSNDRVVRFVFTGTDSSREYWKRCAKAWMPLPEPAKLGGD